MTEDCPQGARKPPMLTIKECDDKFARERKAHLERVAAAEGRADKAGTRAWRTTLALLTLVAAMVGVKLVFPFLWP